MVLATAFFAHETINLDYSSIESANTKYGVALEKSKKAQEDLNESVKGTSLFEIYVDKVAITRNEYATVLNEYEKIKFLEFNSFQQFMGEFGWALGLFIYGLFNLVKSWIRKTKTLIGELTLHTTIIFISIFYLRWCFKKQDFLQVEYILINLVSALSLLFAAYIFIKWKDSARQILLKNIRILTRFIVKNKPQENPKEYIEKYVNTFKSLK